MNHIIEQQIRSEANMDWVANPWITTVRGRILTPKISPPKMQTKHPATANLKITQFRDRNCTVGSDNDFYSCQDLDLKLQ